MAERTEQAMRMKAEEQQRLTVRAQAAAAREEAKRERQEDMAQRAQLLQKQVCVSTGS
jgi:hypothetical protein